ncbi:MAG: hypothetical protein HFJ26_01030 [Clostridia bacterium]|nr:hypothetical protein [Clostridia bacterium]
MERESDLKTKYLIRDVYYYSQIDSTQLEILRRIKANTITNGTLVIADTQTHGKRHSWKSLVYR